MEPPIERWQESTTILIGPQEREIHVHTSKLRQIPFFRACLDAPMKERTSGVIKMPDDDPAAFSEVVDWIYYNKLEVDLPKICAENRDQQPDCIEQLRNTRIRTYLLAKKLIAESLQNIAIDSLRLAWGHILPGANELRLIFKHVDKDDKVHELARRLLAYQICREEGWDEWKALYNHVYLDLLQGDSGLLEVALSAVVSFPGKTYTIRDLPACHFHDHVDTAKCAN